MFAVNLKAFLKTPVHRDDQVYMPALPSAKSIATNPQ